MESQWTRLAQNHESPQRFTKATNCKLRRSGKLRVRVALRKHLKHFITGERRSSLASIRFCSIKESENCSRELFLCHSPQKIVRTSKSALLLIYVRRQRWNGDLRYLCLPSVELEMSDAVRDLRKHQLAAWTIADSLYYNSYRWIENAGNDAHNPNGSMKFPPEFACLKRHEVRFFCSLFPDKLTL